MITSMDSSGRWWLVDGHEVDLNAPEGSYPLNVRSAVLAHRDAVDEPGQDIAALLEWTVEAHPLWTGTCPACDRECGPNEKARGIAIEFLSRQAQRLNARIESERS